VKVSSIVFFIFSIFIFLFFVASVFLSVFGFPDISQLVSGGSLGSSDVAGYIVLGLFLAVVISRYLFVIGLIRIRKKVGISLVAGIVGLVGVIFATLVIGSFVYSTAYPERVIVGFLDFGEELVVKWIGCLFGVFVIVSLLFESLTLFYGSKKLE
jgi:hypothetical protein